MKLMQTQLVTRWMLAGMTALLVLPGRRVNAQGAPGAGAVVLDFSLDIGSDTEFSDPQMDGDEGFDPGDVYLWMGLPLPAGGADGYKDDAFIFTFDPAPDPPVAGTAVPVCVPGAGVDQYREHFDLDGHDQVDQSLLEIIPPDRVLQPIFAFPSNCISEPRQLLVSFDDDRAPGWPAPFCDVPVTAPSALFGVSSYGSTPGRDEVVTLDVLLGGPAPYGLAGMAAPFADERMMHPSMAPNPDAGDATDDDVDSLDALDGDVGQCPVWLFTADHEGAMTLDPGDIYEVLPGGGFAPVIDDVVHLGLLDSTDVDAFELVFLEDPQFGAGRLAVLFSVDDDDPLTTVDESGGLAPMLIYGSFLDGTYFLFLDVTILDDVDAIAVPRQPVNPDPFCGDGICLAPENSCNCPIDCGLPPLSEVPGVSCTDAIDNDCDGATDCADPDCAGDPACRCGDGFCDASIGEDACTCPVDCGPPAAAETPGVDCTDGMDNDCDGATDCADSDCALDPACLCGNGTCDATLGEDACNCPIDCGLPPTVETPGTNCTDGADNDCDGATDCADPDCATDPACLPPADFQIEFSVDIGGDTELSDPFADGDEGFDPGDVYLWRSAPVTPPAEPCGRDGFKDDEFIFGIDPFPAAPDCAFPPATAVPVGNNGDPTDYYEQYFDLDAHDQIDVDLREFIPPTAPLPGPISQFQFGPSNCIFRPVHVFVSYDDDQAPGWPAGDVAVTKPSPSGVTAYGTTCRNDEVIGFTFTPAAPYGITLAYGVEPEDGIHASLTPNPDGGDERVDDDVDSLDIVRDPQGCPFWYFSPDHEARFALDDGDIYLATPAGPVKVIDEAIHLGLDPDTDVDAFEFVWLPLPGAPATLAVLFSVDEDDPLTPVDESGGLIPSMIYASRLTGVSVPVLENPDGLADDIDALMVWTDRLPSGGCLSTSVCPNADVNCDNVVTGADFLIVLNSANFGLPRCAAAEPRADVNGDGTVTGTDALVIISTGCFGM